MKIVYFLTILLLLTGTASAEIITVGDANETYTDMNPSFLAGSDYVAVHQSTDSLPHNFDWRDVGLITPTKDQGKCGACYAFAMVGSAEGTIARQTHVKLDLSENHVMNCNWVGAACLGGTSIMVANLWSHSGIVLEKDDPYYPGFSMCTKAKPVYRVTEWLQISAEKTPPVDTLKRYIMEYGPIYTQLDAKNIPTKNYNGSYVTAALDDIYTTHAVVIIGWDDGHDDIDTTGHWLVKNSWGHGWGDEGVGRIGYGRHNIGKYTSVISEFVPYTTTSHEYAHDAAGFTGGIGYKNSKSAQGMAVFDIGSDAIEEVQFWATGTITDLDIRMYDDFNGTAITGRTLYIDNNHQYNEAGIHTIRLDRPITSKTGKLVLVMTIRIGSSITAKSMTVPLPIDLTVHKPNTTFIRKSTSNPYMMQDWQDTTNLSFSGNLVFRLRTNTPHSTQPATRHTAKERVDNVLATLDTLNQSENFKYTPPAQDTNLITKSELDKTFKTISDKIENIKRPSLVNRILNTLLDIFQREKQ